MARQWRELPALISRVSMKPFESARTSTSINGLSHSRKQQPPQAQATSSGPQPLQSIALLAGVFLSGLLYRNVSIDELFALLQGMQLTAIRIQNDRITLYVSMLIAGFAFHLMQQYCDTRTINEPTATFEDVYQKEIHIPTAYFDSANILKAFFKDKYAGSNAEPFIEANLFNITFGKRDGRCLELSELSASDRVKARTHLIMAIHWRLLGKNCTECGSPLHMGLDNWSSCSFFRKSYFSRELGLSLTGVTSVANKVSQDATIDPPPTVSKCFTGWNAVVGAPGGRIREC